jgi:hypothetical protein
MKSLSNTQKHSYFYSLAQKLTSPSEIFKSQAVLMYPKMWVNVKSLSVQAWNWVQQLLSSCKRTVKEAILCRWNITWAKQTTGRLYKSHFGSEIRTHKTRSGNSSADEVGKDWLGAYLKNIKAAAQPCVSARDRTRRSLIYLVIASNLEHKDGRTLANQILGMCQPCWVIQS